MALVLPSRYTLSSPLGDLNIVKIKKIKKTLQQSPPYRWATKNPSLSGGANALMVLKGVSLCGSVGSWRIYGAGIQLVCCKGWDHDLRVSPTQMNQCYIIQTPLCNHNVENRALHKTVMVPFSVSFSCAPSMTKGCEATGDYVSAEGPK